MGRCGLRSGEEFRRGIFVGRNSRKELPTTLLISLLGFALFIFVRAKLYSKRNFGVLSQFDVRLPVIIVR
jgi:hypothetical protein